MGQYIHRLTVTLVDSGGVLEQVERALRQAVDGVATRHVDAPGAVPRPTETDCIVIPDSSEVDGLEHVRAVCERTDSVAVVVVAIDASDGFARDAKAAGADDVICIPSDESADDLFPGAVAERIRHAADRTDPFADDAALLDDLLDNIPHRVFIKNQYGRFAAVSGAKANHYGLTREDVVGLSDFELNPEMGAELREQEVEIMETGEPVVNEVDSYVDDDGRNRWVSTTKAPRRDETGDVVGIVGSTRDVTAQRRHEEMLNALHTASRDLVAAESSTEIVDVATNIAEDVPDMPTVVVAVAEDEGLTFEAACELDCDCYGQCEPTLETSYEMEAPIAVLEDGDRRRYDAVSEGSTPTCVAFPLGDHGALGVVDMDDLLTDSALELAEVFAANVRTALDSAARKERLASQNERLEEFAGIVSHDLRNPLSIAQGYLELIEGNPEIVGEIDAALERIERMSDDLLTLARDGEIVGEVESERIADAAADAWDSIETDEATLAVGEDVGTVDADRERLVELLENLFSNAVEHGSTNPESGVRQDAVEHAPSGDEPIRIRVGPLDDGFYVADDGQGIPDEEKSDVFDRTFTTAEDGTGLGLRIVDVMADAHGWTIHLVDSESGGARFEIRTE